MSEPIPATTPLAVILEAQQWNAVLAALADAPYKLAAPLIQSIGDQLQRGATEQQKPYLNGGLVPPEATVRQ
jgi:hypothetical protein